MNVSETRLVADGSALGATGLIHRMWQPAGVGPHPAVVMLHGRSGDEDVMWVFASTLPRDWLIVAPRGLQPDPDGGYTWHPRTPDQWPTLQAFDTAVATVVRLLRALPDLYHADPDHIYLMGFSQGAALAFATAMRQPGLVQGIAALVGFIPTDCADAASLAALKDLLAFMAVGQEDERIPLERSQACARTLRAAGARLEYHEYNTGHKLSAEALRDLKAWWEARGKESLRRSDRR
ncbi:MAG TPA: alpha/beta fold hydrolase [Anaerolineae bacterium]|nr:alpha/beta fold hydrolase [Anaerolineae bacterium]